MFSPLAFLAAQIRFGSAFDSIASLFPFVVFDNILGYVLLIFFVLNDLIIRLEVRVVKDRLWILY